MPVIVVFSMSRAAFVYRWSRFFASPSIVALSTCARAKKVETCSNRLQKQLKTSSFMKKSEDLNIRKFTDMKICAMARGKNSKTDPISLPPD